MGTRFNGLGKEEQAAVAAYVSAEYDKLLLQQPTSYVAKNAQSDPDRWMDGLRELIAADPKRLQAIVEKALRDKSQGFTLIEMSIVLVIIGLIIGGILTGQSLINAAAVRAQVSQIEQYNTAVNTFYGKYQALPGDMNAQTATAGGFSPRGFNGYYAGMGDGNGLIEGSWNPNSNSNSGNATGGEPLLFWNDLTWAKGQNLNLIPGSFSAETSASTNPTTIPAIGAWLPAARIGQGNYVYAWSANGINYFGLSAVVSFGLTPFSSAGLTVAQANAIDTKIDDGLPQSGGVIAYYLVSSWSAWAQGGVSNSGYSAAAPGSAANPWSGSCYDNGNNASNPTHYSIQISGGAGVNCALSFQMQGAGR